MDRSIAGPDDAPGVTEGGGKREGGYGVTS